MRPRACRSLASTVASLALVQALSSCPVEAQETAAPRAPFAARISEEVRTLATYPFGEPNPVPILTKDRRLYPYHSFEGYSVTSEPREWKVVKLENDLIEVFVLPEVGGKVWGAVVKATGHEFIYRNEVLKFRNIALRGPWTSGGIEMNFGVIGHTPSTATPVDYLLRENPDGSVSCWVGAMDLPSRTVWRVEIRLPPDEAVFETNVLWYNPTPLEQPYYNWMTAAAFARSDLEMYMPGDAYLEHSGQVWPWPVDEEGRYLPRYAENTFGGHKSYHVVGEIHDFFGGYYHDEGWGFGHWARYEDMPGQKLWLWALSREGGVWEDLLTDTDGQYVEFQAGRLFVQYSPGADVNPISQAGFGPLSASRWSERWFPVEGIGGISEASPHGALFVVREGGQVTVRVNAFGDVRDTLRVWSGDRLILERPLTLAALAPHEAVVQIDPRSPFRVRLSGLGLDHRSAPDGRRISRPFATDSSAFPSMSESARETFEARELMKARRYVEARRLFAAALEEDPWNRDALLGMAGLEMRSGRNPMALDLADRARQLDAYDAEANYMAGLAYRAMRRETASGEDPLRGQRSSAFGASARDAFAWAARSPGYRTAAYVQLADMMIVDGELAEAERYARLAIDFDRYSVPGWQALAVVGRIAGNRGLAEEARGELLALDPLHHFVGAERYLESREDAEGFVASLGGEYPDQTLLELAIGYEALGRVQDAAALLELADPGAPPATESGSVSRGPPPPRATLDRERAPGEPGSPRTRLRRTPLIQAWHAWLTRDATLLRPRPDPALTFPYRPESVEVLRWASAHDEAWVWKYLFALNEWALADSGAAVDMMESLGEEPDWGPFYAARAALLGEARGVDPERDLRRAVEMDSEDRILHVLLIQHLQGAGRWADALATAEAARARFPGDFNLALLHAKSLIHLARPSPAVEILETAHVLPSENGRESHRLWEQAHTLAALDALEGEHWGEARSHLLAAMEWPENLGQGRPYEPEERLARFLLGLAERSLGNDEEAADAFAAVLTGTPRLDALLRGEGGGVGPQPLELLVAPALEALGRGAEAERVRQGWAREERRIRDTLDEGLEGRMILRALSRMEEGV